MPELDYFKKKLIQILTEQEKEIRKSRGYPVGTIREWKGKKFKKVGEGKWVKVYESVSRGAKLSIAAVKRKIDHAQSAEELLQIVLMNKQRFIGNDGFLLPIVKELNEYIDRKNRPLEELKEAGKDDEQPKKQGHTRQLRDRLMEDLRPQFGLHKNKKTGIDARLSKKSVDKMSSEKAIEKSKMNGFTIDDHFEVAEKIVDLYKNADLVESRPDKNNDPNVISMKRFESSVELSSGENVIAYITVKETKEQGHRLYSIEVTEIKKATDKSVAGDATGEPANRATKTPHVSTPSIPQHNKKSSEEHQNLSEGMKSNKNAYKGGKKTESLIHFIKQQINIDIEDYIDDRYSRGRTYVMVDLKKMPKVQQRELALLANKYPNKFTLSDAGGWGTAFVFGKDLSVKGNSATPNNAGNSQYNKKSRWKSTEQTGDKNQSAQKSLFTGGYPVGTIREWKGRRYLRTSEGKWKIGQVCARDA